MPAIMPANGVARPQAGRVEVTATGLVARLGQRLEYRHLAWLGEIPEHHVSDLHAAIEREREEKSPGATVLAHETRAPLDGVANSFKHALMVPCDLEDAAALVV